MPSPQFVSTRAETRTYWTTTSCAKSAASEVASWPTMLYCAACSGGTCSTSMKKNPMVWIGTVLAVESPTAKIAKGSTRRSCHLSETLSRRRALGGVRSGSRNQMVAALISARPDIK